MLGRRSLVVAFCGCYAVALVLQSPATLPLQLAAGGDEYSVASYSGNSLRGVAKQYSTAQFEFPNFAWSATADILSACVGYNLSVDDKLINLRARVRRCLPDRILIDNVNLNGVYSELTRSLKLVRLPVSGRVILDIARLEYSADGLQELDAAIAWLNFKIMLDPPILVGDIESRLTDVDGNLHAEISGGDPILNLHGSVILENGGPYRATFTLSTSGAHELGVIDELRAFGAVSQGEQLRIVKSGCLPAIRPFLVTEARVC